MDVRSLTRLRFDKRQLSNLMNAQGDIAAQKARACSHTYYLLSHLYLRGLTAGLLPFIQAIPELTVALPPDFSDDASALDELAADHYDILQTNVFVHESYFLDSEGLIGGSVAEQLLGFYHQTGFEPPLTDTSGPDHFSLQLACLGWLCSAEADAHDDDQSGPANRMRNLQRRFLDEHLLRWLLPLTQAIRQQGHPFYTSLADITFEMVLAHRTNLSDDLMVTQQTSFALPSAPDLLDDQKTGLKEVAAYLLTPAYSGIFLSRKDIEMLARRQKIPRGFGNRLQMFTNLLRATASHDLFDSLLDDLASQLQSWQILYTRHLTAIEPLATISAIWLERLNTTHSIINRLRDEASQQRILD